MRINLLPEEGKFYKVNMHSHSNLSDGVQTPEQLKELYKAKGYSAIAYTEHGKIHDLTHLNDEDFIAITSYELDMTKKDNPPFVFYEGAPKTFSHYEVIHMNLYAKDPHNTQRVDVSDLRDNFCIENVNEAIRRAKEQGFLVSYNHPNWSLNTYPFYSQLEGLDALEIVNGASNRSSDLDYAPYVYDQMNRAGKKLICVGGDDNHDTCHFFLAWTMVKAPELTHEALLAALERGDCYSSDGPEIYDLYVEDGKVHIRCSDAAGIFYTSAGRKKNCKLAPDYDHPVNEAVFPIPEDDICFRLSVKDIHGKHANTRYFFINELKA